MIVLRHSMPKIISILKRLVSALEMLVREMGSLLVHIMPRYSQAGPLAHRYESVFCIFLVALAFLFRDNPYLVYPTILYLLLLLMALNLAASKALEVGRFGKELSALVILANCGTIAAILSYSGEQASNLWVLFLLPIYTACMLLDGREVAWVTSGAISCNVIYYIFATVYWSSVTYFEISIKTAILAFAAVTTWKVVLQERRSQQMLRVSSEELERSEHYLELFRRLVGQIDDAILVVNTETGRWVDINGTWSLNLGYPREEFKGIGLSDLPGFLPDGLNWTEFVARVQEKKSLRFECEPQRLNKTICPMEVHIQWVSQEGQDYLIAVARDVTDRKRAETQLRQAQKMEAVGRLAGGVAHDFNNMLSVIIGISDMLLETMEKDNPLREDLEQISQAADRSADLTHQLLAFSRQNVVQPRVLDLNAAVKDTTKMLQRLIGENIRLQAALAPELGPIRVDPSQLQQVLLNLTVNARDAMPRGGSLIIKTANVELKEAFSDARDTIPAGPYVTLRIEDTGMGMDTETLNHLFEPFFTTKEIGKGTGLGLSVIHSVIKQSGGYIQVQSTPGLGTAFTIYFLPASEVVGDQKADAKKKPGPREATILLAEDEAAVRNIAQRILVHAGYKVLVAQDGDDAMRQAKEHQGAIHLLLSDVVMPGMSGPELAGHLSKIHPETKALFMSGYVGPGGLQKVEGAAFMLKPISPNVLTHKVREILDSVAQ